ncbi:hypothetical protein AALP_AA4G026700 [Arabis alpina]|uniref:Cyclin-dependent kinase inhibitor domain-containing protein n=1 Tax=Arabis alpina TaxID=50452 RepID=A0A087H0Q7_ARAAL|nr:hypothetical protein AALP_AA4G026700 [Arabis alpina]
MAAGEVNVRGRRRERDVTDQAMRSAVLETPTVKRKKIEEEVESRIVLSPCATRNFAGVVIVRRRDSLVEEQSQNDSCCSGNTRSEEKSKRRIEFVDFEENNASDQRETSSNLNKRNDQEESVKYIAMEKQSSQVKEAEIEDFFQTAEKDVRNQMLECSRKYNFDFEKDEPLGGRYEWVKLNPSS